MPSDKKNVLIEKWRQTLRDNDDRGDKDTDSFYANLSDADIVEKYMGRYGSIAALVDIIDHLPK